MRRLLVLALLFVIGVALPLGCSTKVTDSGKQVLSIYNWATYIDEETIPEFEEKFNVEVKYDTFESNEALLAKIQPGNPGYDIIVPTGDFVESMASEGLLLELNHENIPNLKYLDEAFVDPPFDPGNRYSVPYQWGTIGIGYNIEKTGEEITSWGQVFNPKYSGRVALMEDARAMMGAILIYLGYDPNTTDPEQLEEAKNFLIDKKDVIATFAPDTGQDLLDQGEVDIAIEWSGDIFQIMEENDAIRYAIPEEGTIIWTDNLAIPEGAPNKELAEKFINFTLEPEVSARISNYVKFGTPNRAAIDQGLIEKEDLENPGIYPPPETFGRLKYAKNLGEQTAIYDEIWTELKVALGK